MKILIVVDMQKDFISGPLGTAEARAIVPYVAEKAKNAPRENLFVTLDTHQPNYMETNEGRHLPVPHCIEGTEGHALDDAIAAAVMAFRRPALSASRPSARWHLWTRYALCTSRRRRSNLSAYALAFA
ncbi:cysteine hydrolase family protein [Butyricicoccus sp. OF10-2]|uniref:cysteine hydrolase family protein n=1 Tax=Butyricicoccus sp. OF10-2 TaxID=2292298 RepID=UPI002E8DFA56